MFLPLLRADAETYMRQAGFVWDIVIETKNRYYPSMSQEEPYLLFLTQFGPIELGGRKRVAEVVYRHTGLRRKIVDEVNVTSEEHLFHAWSAVDLMRYLDLLKQALDSFTEEERNANHRRGDYSYRPIAVGPHRNPAG